MALGLGQGVPAPPLLQGAPRPLAAQPLRGSFASPRAPPIPQRLAMDSADDDSDPGRAGSGGGGGGGGRRAQRALKSLASNLDNVDQSELRKCARVDEWLETPPSPEKERLLREAVGGEAVGGEAAPVPGAHYFGRLQSPDDAGVAVAAAAATARLHQQKQGLAKKQKAESAGDSATRKIRQFDAQREHGGGVDTDDEEEQRRREEARTARRWGGLYGGGGGGGGGGDDLTTFAGETPATGVTVASIFSSDTSGHVASAADAAAIAHEIARSVEQLKGSNLSVFNKNG